MGRLYKAKAILVDVILIFLSVLCLFTVVPAFIVICVVPLLLLRGVSILTAKFKDSLGKPLSITSCHTAIDDVHGDPRCTLVTVLYLKDRLDVDKLLDRVSSLLNADKYPELKQTLTRWMYTYFWKKCPDFSIHNHVIFDQSSDVGEFREKIESLVSSPYKEEQPLWEIIAFPNYKNPDVFPSKHPRMFGGESSSALAIRIHHSLADGFAFLNLVKSIADPQLPDEVIEKRVSFSENLTWAQKSYQFGILLLITPVQTVHTILKSFDSNILTKSKKSGKTVHYESYNEFNQDVLKQVSKSRGKSISALIFSLFTAALRNAMLIRVDIDKIPKFATILYPWARQGHPGTLTNYLTCVAIPAPLFIIDSEQRLTTIYEKFVHIHSTSLDKGMLLVNLIVGLISGFTKKEVRIGHFGTAILSNFLYTSKPLVFFGSEATHCNILTGLQRSEVSLMCTAVNYNGKLVIGAKGDCSIFPSRESLQYFVKCMKDELYNLYKCEDVV